MGFLSQLTVAAIRDGRRASRHRRSSRSIKERTKLFNRKWKKLIKFVNLVNKEFLNPMVPFLNRLTVKEDEKLAEYIQEHIFRNEYINKNINNCTQRDLSWYATSVKNVAVISMELNMKYNPKTKIRSVKYIGKDRTIYLNGKQFYTFD